MHTHTHARTTHILKKNSPCQVAASVGAHESQSLGLCRLVVLKQREAAPLTPPVSEETLYCLREHGFPSAAPRGTNGAGKQFTCSPEVEKELQQILQNALIFLSSSNHSLLFSTHFRGGLSAYGVLAGWTHFPPWDQAGPLGGIQGGNGTHTMCDALLCHSHSEPTEDSEAQLARRPRLLAPSNAVPSGTSYVST